MPTKKKTATKAARKPTASAARKRASDKSPAKRAAKKSPVKGKRKATDRNGGRNEPAPLKLAVVGRPRKVTPETLKLVRDALLKGNFIETSLAYAGLTRAAGYDAMRRGRAEVSRIETKLAAEFEGSQYEPTDDDFDRLLDPRERIYVEFLYTIQSCTALAEVSAVDALHTYTATIKNDSQARALLWRLSRRWSKRWHKSDTSIGVDVDLEVESRQEVAQEGVRYTEVAVITRAGTRVTLDGLDLEARDFDDEFGGDEDEHERELEAQAGRSLPM